MTKTISMQFGPKVQKTWLDICDQTSVLFHVCFVFSIPLTYTGITKCPTNTYTVVYTDHL